MITVLSPHLDDAVLSCWHVLAGDRPAAVVNVFTGPPENGAPSGWWDHLTGASDGAARVAERIEEDRRALGLVGREAVNIGLPEVEYRRNGLRPADLREALAEHLREGPVYAPAGLGREHPDHTLVLAAAAELCGWERIRVYADLPHATVFGWPASVTGTAADPNLDVDRFWRWTLQKNGLDPGRLEQDVHRLDDYAFERKLAAFRAYRTQAPAIAQLRPLDELRHEVVWRVRGEGAR